MSDFQELTPSQKAELERTLFNLHVSVSKLVHALNDNAGLFDNADEILNKLPMLDFYNDDLLTSIQALKRTES